MGVRLTRLETWGSSCGTQKDIFFMSKEFPEKKLGQKIEHIKAVENKLRQ